MRIHLLRFAIALALAAPLAALPVAARDYGSVDKVNGGIEIDANSTAENLETVNGGIRVGEDSVIRSAETVNGGIRLDAGAHAESIETVNGGVHLGPNVVVSDNGEAVNGGIVVKAGGDIGGNVANINGGIELERAHVAGGLETTNGDITVGDGSRVERGIMVKKPHGFGMNWGHSRPPRVVIGAGAVVDGALTFEREVELYVHQSAKVGPISGAKAVSYTGDRPPN